MVKVLAFEEFDIADTYKDSEDASVSYADEELIIGRDDIYEYYYYGDYTYDDESFEGTIKRIDGYNFDGELVFEFRRLELGVDMVASAGSNYELVKEIFAGDDLIRGSEDADKLGGFAGNDAIRGGQGDDVLAGRRGADNLRGDRDDDRLRGGDGRDILEGGHGDDFLRGDERRDVFVFDANDGRDIIRDFQNRFDKIQIEDGADSFRDLELTVDGDDVLVAFGETEIILRDFHIDDLGRGDFVF